MVGTIPDSRGLGIDRAVGGGRDQVAVSKAATDLLEKEGRIKIFVSEAALTIEAGFVKFFDKVIVSSCRKDVQVKRLMERDGIPRKEAEKKISSQMPLEAKKKYADYVIDTSGTLTETVEQTERVYAQLVRDYELKTQKTVRRKS